MSTSTSQFTHHHTGGNISSGRVRCTPPPRQPAADAAAPVWQRLSAVRTRVISKTVAVYLVFDDFSPADETLGIIHDS